jgi:hypothetical protein
MQYRDMGQTGMKVSVVGFGGIPIQRVTEKEADAIVGRALDSGINFFDTARGYTDSEAKLGKVLGARRSEAIIATKSLARDREGMAADVRKSLQTLGVDCIDLYQMHNVKDQESLNKVLGPGGALEALQEAKREGLIRHIGVTGHIKNFLEEIIVKSGVETVQFPFNAVETKGADELMQLAGERQLGVIIMKPLAGGALREQAKALRFIMAHPISVVIPGMDSLEQVVKNAEVGDDPRPLTRAEQKELEEEAVRLGAAFCRRCEYCQPCPQGIDIPTVFLLDGYFTRYDLQDWAQMRYRGLTARVDDCIACGACEERCPYSLPIQEMLAEAATRLA